VSFTVHVVNLCGFRVADGVEMRWRNLGIRLYERTIKGHWWFAWHPIRVGEKTIWLERVFRYKRWDCDGIYPVWEYDLKECIPPSWVDYKKQLWS
jgi:hypothetical protein